MSTDIQQSDPVAELKARISNPALAFASDESVDDLVKYVREQALAQSLDVDASTSAGRRSLVSIAARVAKSKVYLKSQATDVVKAMKERIAMVNGRADRMVEELEDLRDKIRQPVTDWENAEAARVKACQDKLTEIRSIASQVVSRIDWFNAATEIDQADKLLGTLRNHDWQEFAEDAQVAIKAADEAIAAARDGLERRQKEAAEKEEMKRQLAEAQEAKRQADEAKQKAEATEKALNASNELYGIANDSAGKDAAWIHAMNLRVHGYKNDPHPTVRTAYAIASRALDVAMQQWEAQKPPVAPVAPVETDATTGGFHTPADAPAEPLVERKTAAKPAKSKPFTHSFLTDRDCILELLHTASEIYDLVEDLWSEARPGMPFPGSIEALKIALDSAEQHIKK